MKAVVQRVKETSLRVDGELISQIPFGLIVYFGVKKGDELSSADYLAGKIARLRIFEDENGKMNKSVLDVGGEVMSVSQFTLLGDVSHGNRPSFIEAEVPDRAEEIYNYFCEKLASYGVAVKKGVFGADMKISQLSDGPVTIIYDV
ncbi:MAG: D-tyrosyl-tRNA(Tyr) deacylase [Clostridia bacterium]|nr:D-tyrosyl-tRNA(Tyr) deacylase [Clostridia bacterium]